MNHELLKMERIRQGWSQAKLAEEMGVDTRTVRRWEQGRTIPFPYYRKQLCALFDKTAEELGLPCDTDENKAVEYAALAVQQPTETLEAEQLETPELAFSQIVADSALTQSDAPITQQQPVSSLNGHFHAHQEAINIFEDHLFGFRSLWDVHIFLKKNRGPFRPTSRFPRHLFLIISTILLVVLVITVVLPPFHRQPSPSQPHTQESYGPPSYTLTIPTVDPSLLQTAQRLQQAFHAVYPQLVKRFALDPATAARNVTLTFSFNLSSPATISGTTITLNLDWMRQHPTDMGLLTHELTLLLQQYPSGSPAWFRNGMADYARYVYGPADDDDWSLPDGVQPHDNYTQGGAIAARFLLWLEQYTTLDIVDQLNHALQTRQSFSDTFYHLTHHTVDELWSQYTGYPAITLLPEQLYKTAISRKPIYQSSFHVQAQLNTYAYDNARGLSLSNFTIQTDITITRGDAAGFFFRDVGNDATLNYRGVLLSVDGRYGLFIQRQVIASAYSSAIKVGLHQTNRLAVVVQKHTFYVYINSQFITQFDDENSNYGTLGPWAASDSTPTDAWFKNFQVI